MRLFIISLLVVGLTAMAGFTAVGGDDIVFGVKGAGNVTFSHDTHVGIGRQCTDCHDSLYVTKEKHKKVSMADMNKGQSCGACHNGKQASTVKGKCTTCHKK